jgi:phage baseplate assembly protein W
MLLGMDRFTGEPLQGLERAVQSVETTLTTPFKSQPGQRAYGNDFPNLISEPLVGDTVMRAYGALVDAFDWEPEAELLNYGLSDADELGHVTLWYQARFTPTGEIFTRVIGRSGNSAGGGDA